MKVVTKGIIFLDVLGLFCKAVLRIENFISVLKTESFPIRTDLGW